MQERVSPTILLPQKHNYFGGAISPGLQMRYKALHNNTAKLPLLEPSALTSHIGTTEMSIHSGVVNGIITRNSGGDVFL